MKFPDIYKKPCFQPPTIRVGWGQVPTLFCQELHEKFRSCIDLSVEVGVHLKKKHAFL